MCVWAGIYKDVKRWALFITVRRLLLSSIYPLPGSFALRNSSLSTTQTKLPTTLIPRTDDHHTMPATPTEKIPRPPNAFICFRSARASERAAAGVRQNELSVQVAAEWRALDHATRAYYARVAAEKKEEHESLYPGYKYQPQRRAAAVVGPASASAGVSGRTRSGGQGTTTTTRAGTRAGAAMSGSASRTRSSKSASANAIASRAAQFAPPPGPHSASRPPSTASYSPSPSHPPPSPSPAPMPALPTWYVPIPAATFTRLVTGPSPPARTVSPAALHTPHLLAYASLHELADAVALPLAPAPAHTPHGLGLFVPVPVKAFRAQRGAGPAVEAYPSMRAVRAVAVVEDALEAFLGNGVGLGEAVIRGEDVRALRFPEESGPFLVEETRWPAVYPGMGGGAP